LLFTPQCGAVKDVPVSEVNAAVAVAVAIVVAAVVLHSLLLFLPLNCSLLNSYINTSPATMRLRVKSFLALSFPILPPF
jgi:hypothetical protein